MRPTFLMCALLLAVTACGGAGGGSAAAPPAAPGPSRTQSSAKIIITIPRAAAASTRRPNIITAQTATIVLSVVGVNGAPPSYTIPALTVHLNDPAYCTTTGSTTTCTINYLVPVAANVVVQITTFDSGGNQLGVGTLSVDTTQTTIPPTTVAIGGVPTTAQFTQTNLVFPDNGTSTSISSSVTLKVYDADNNLLISPATYGGSITIAAVNDATSALTFAQPSLTAPDATTGASNTVNVSYNGTKALGATTAITATFNGKVLASIPVAALNYTPSSITNFVIGGSSETVTVNEGNYSGAFAVSGNATKLSYTCSPANCTPGSAGGSVTFTFTPQAAGSGTLTFTDTASTAALVPFSVTGQSGGTITVANYKSYLYSPPTANSQPGAIAAGPDGKSVWFVEAGMQQVARVDTTSCLDTASPPACTIDEEANAQYFPQPAGLASGNDGNVYLTNGGANGGIVQLTTAGSGCASTQPMTCSAVPETMATSAPNPAQIVRGNNGLLYFIDSQAGANDIWDFPSASASIGISEVFFSPASAWNFSSLTLDSSGNLWVADNGSNDVGETYKACSDCGISLQEYGGFATGAGPTFGQLTYGNDGNIWVAESAANSIAYFSPASCTAGPPATCTVNHLAIPTANAGASGIAQGTDGNIWFTETNTGKVGIVTNCPSACKIVELAVGSSTSGPAGISAGPDGNMWFTLLGSGQIGKVVP